MTVHDIPVAETIKGRLLDILAEARQVKPEPTSIEPALDLNTRLKEAVGSVAVVRDAPPPEDATQEEAEDDIEDKDAGTDEKSKPHWAGLETAARDIFYTLLSTHTIDSDAYANGFGDVWNLLDVLQFCADAGQCDASLPLWLVEELLDSQTIEGCRRVFDYLESRRERLITKADASNRNNKKMIVLRSCNELLRRLSRAEDAVFCGRVFVFLFGSFPLGDKSSVNLRGEFHTENTTVFDDVIAKGVNERTADGDGEAMDGVDEVDPGEAEKAENGDEEDKMEVDGEGKTEETQGTEDGKNESAKTDSDQKDGDAAKKIEGEDQAAKPDEGEKPAAEETVSTDQLYTIFWSLQHVFSNPTKIFNLPDFEEFKKGLELTLNKFKSTQVLQTHSAPRAAGEAKRGIKRRRSSRADHEFASNFNPKYLTSRDLFELEMSDLTFQRHILVQALIMIDFLLSLTPKAKKRLTELKVQRAMVYNFTLNEDDTKWATNMRAAIANYLQEGPDGKFYYRMADTVLARDKNWVRWKIEACPPIEKPPIPTSNAVEARTGAQRACAPRRLKANPLGAVELSFLSDTENANGLETLRKPERHTAAPEVEKYLRDIETADLDLEMASQEERVYLVETRASSAWRALRLAAKDRLAVFHKIDQAEGLKDLAVSAEGGAAEEEAAALKKEEEAEEADDVAADASAKASDNAVADVAPSDDVVADAVAEVEKEDKSGVEATEKPEGDIAASAEAEAEVEQSAEIVMEDAPAAAEVVDAEREADASAEEHAPLPMESIDATAVPSAEDVETGGEETSALRDAEQVQEATDETDAQEQ